MCDFKILYNRDYSTPGDDNITDQKDIQNRRGEGVYRIPVQLADKFEESFHSLFEVNFADQLPVAFNNRS